MSKFRKKPVVVDAIQWKGNNVREIRRELGAAAKNVGASGTQLYVPTLEGAMWAVRGDWIIKGVKGEIYPCKPDIFEMTYESEG